MAARALVSAHQSSPSRAPQARFCPSPPPADHRGRHHLHHPAPPERHLGARRRRAAGPDDRGDGQRRGVRGRVQRSGRGLARGGRGGGSMVCMQRARCAAVLHRRCSSPPLAHRCDVCSLFSSPAALGTLRTQQVSGRNPGCLWGGPCSGRFAVGGGSFVVLRGTRFQRAPPYPTSRPCRAPLAGAARAQRHVFCCRQPGWVGRPSRSCRCWCCWNGRLKAAAAHAPTPRHCAGRLQEMDLYGSAMAERFFGDVDMMYSDGLLEFAREVGPH